MEGAVYLDGYKPIRCKSRLKPIRRSGDLLSKLLKQRKRGRLNAVSDDLLFFCIYCYPAVLPFSKTSKMFFRLAESSWPGAEAVPAVPNVMAEPKVEPAMRLMSPSLPIEMVTIGRFAV